MVRVFISYSNDLDGPRARALEEFLRSKSEGRLEPRLALRTVSHAEENAEKIARLIRSSSWFVSFYTKGGRENQWVNQELGYAIALAKSHNIRILPLYEDRAHLAGFLNSRMDNLSAEFKLGAKPDDEIWKAVGDFLMDATEGPVELAVEMVRNSQEHALAFDIHISNRLDVVLRSVVLHFITPLGVTVRTETSEPPPFVTWRNGRGFMFHQNQPIPVALKDRLTSKKPEEIPLEARADHVILADLPMTTVSQRWVLNLPSHWHSAGIAVAVQAQGFEPSLYELFVAREQSRWRGARLERKSMKDKAFVSIHPDRA